MMYGIYSIEYPFCALMQVAITNVESTTRTNDANTTKAKSILDYFDAKLYYCHCSVWKLGETTAMVVW